MTRRCKRRVKPHYVIVPVAERRIRVATILSMPKWGLSMKTGLIVEWLKKAGEPVQRGESVVEIESEKATNEVEAPSLAS